MSTVIDRLRSEAEAFRQSTPDAPAGDMLEALAAIRDSEIYFGVPDFSIEIGDLAYGIAVTEAINDLPRVLASEDDAAAAELADTFNKLRRAGYAA